MDIVRHPRAYGLTERVIQTIPSLKRYCCAESRFDWTSHLLCNCSTIFLWSSYTFTIRGDVWVLTFYPYTFIITVDWYC
jgi:hypothetical protein